MKQVYMSFSCDILHYGHINILNKAANLGELTVGVLTDDVIAQYKRPPFVPFEERRKLFEQLNVVARVVRQEELSYRNIIERIRPDIVVHGDDWKTGVQSVIRREVVELLNAYGGKLIEYPYTKDDHVNLLEQSFRDQYAIPEIRRGMLHRLLELKKPIRVLEAHNGLTGLIAEQARVDVVGGIKQFDAMWISSLCDSASRGKPDIELVDWTKRIEKINEIMEVTTKPIILDGDTGGLTEHFIYNVQTLERLGVSAVIIEDKIGLKRNSLFGTEVEQEQDSIQHFCDKIRKGKRALKTKEFMIIARIESLILDKGMNDALERGRRYIEAGADALMIHSKKRKPNEIYKFANQIKVEFPDVPLVAVPTTYNQVTEEELSKNGLDIVIYANHLLRSAFPVMKNVAETILREGSSKRADEWCMPINEVIRFIPIKEWNELVIDE